MNYAFRYTTLQFGLPLVAGHQAALMNFWNQSQPDSRAQNSTGIAGSRHKFDLEIEKYTPDGKEYTLTASQIDTCPSYDVSNDSCFSVLKTKHC
jgi:hypothetical protein